MFFLVISLKYMVIELTSDITKTSELLVLFRQRNNINGGIDDVAVRVVVCGADHFIPFLDHEGKFFRLQGAIQQAQVFHGLFPLNVMLPVAL